MAKHNTKKKKDNPPDPKESGDADKIPKCRSAVKTQSKTQTILPFVERSAGVPLTHDTDIEREERGKKKLEEKELKKMSKKIGEQEKAITKSDKPDPSTQETDTGREEREETKLGEKESTKMSGNKGKKEKAIKKSEKTKKNISKKGKKKEVVKQIEVDHSHSQSEFDQIRFDQIHLKMSNDRIAKEQLNDRFQVIRLERLKAAKDAKEQQIKQKKIKEGNDVKARENERLLAVDLNEARGKKLL
jgi:hypothetical protein